MDREIVDFEKSIYSALAEDCLRQIQAEPEKAAAAHVETDRGRISAYVHAACFMPLFGEEAGAHLFVHIVDDGYDLPTPTQIVRDGIAYRIERGGVR